MKKVFIAAALAAMIVSCGSKGNKSAEIIAESESDSIFAVNDSTLGELQTYSYEGILPAADAEGLNYQLTLQEAGQDSLGSTNKIRANTCDEIPVGSVINSKSNP
jgi:copper homeostasis protein (lipoprotein)